MLLYAHRRYHVVIVASLLAAGLVGRSADGVFADQLLGQKLYVAPGGNDSWTGTLPEPNREETDGPLATLPAAQRALQRLNAQGHPGVRITVLVREGVYELTEPLIFGAKDSGTAEAPVVLQAWPGEKPRLVGALPVSRFRPHTGKVLRCDLAGSELEGVVFRQLFLGTRRMVMARYPNVDPKDAHFGRWAHVVAPTSEGVKDSFRCTSDMIKDWTNVRYGEVCIHPAYGWAWNICPIKSTGRQPDVITLARPTSYELRVGDRYFVQNLLQELDAPSEWYLDREANTLYFWPPEDLDGQEVRAPVTQTLIVMEGTRHVTVRGFVLEACEGDAVRFSDSQDCRVAACTIRNCGGWAVNILSGQRCAAVGNDIYDTGAGGIRLLGGDRRTLARGDNCATNNYIHHVAAFRRTYHGGLLINGVGNTASHNLVHDCYHQGIGLGGNDNVVEYNIVHHTNLGSEDTGGLYMSSRDYTARGNLIRHNVFHHLGGFGKANSWRPVSNGRVKFEYPHFTWGIYLDAPETGVRVFGNVLYSVPVCGLFNHSGKDNTWENNIVVDAPAFRAGVWGRGELFETSWSHLRRARKEGYLDRYLAKYPELARYDENEPRANTMFNCRFIRNIVYYTKDGGRWLRERQRRDWDNGQLVWTYRGHRDDFSLFEFDWNTVYAPPGIEPKFDLMLTPGSRQLLDWAGWKKTGQDEHSILANPLFVDPAAHDYRLRPDSPALKLGFKPIPFDKIGPQADELRASWPIVEAPGAAALGDFTTERYFELPGYKPVPAKELVPRVGIPRVQAKLAAGQPLTIACFSGGSHAQGGWFKAFVDSWRRRYPKSKITGVSAGIHGGARGSKFSVYRFEHEVLRHRPDLIFIDFAADDTETDAEGIWSAVEGMVRQAWQADPTIDLVFVYSFRLGFEKDYENGMCPTSVSAYEKLAEHYGIPAINVGFGLTKLAQKGELRLRSPASGEKPAGNQPVFSANGVNTSPAAWQICARIIAEGCERLQNGRLVETKQSRGKALAQPFWAGAMTRARQIPITKAMLSGNWQSREPGAFRPHFEQIWFTNQPGATLTFRFKGTAASIFDLIGPDTGQVKITIDGKEAGVRHQVDPWCFYQRLSSLNIAGGLDDTMHTVTIELLAEPPDRSRPIAEAKRLQRYREEDFEGIALRFGWIRIRGEPAD